MLVDAEAPFEEQDTRIADLVEREGRAVVIGINKVDLVERQPGVRTRLREIADRVLPQIKGVPVVALSARTGEGLDRLLTAVMESYAVWNRRVPTAALNRFLGDAVSAHPPPAISGRRVRLDYITQPKARPPTFVLFSSRASALPETYRRYLINGLREASSCPARRSGSRCAPRPIPMPAESAADGAAGGRTEIETRRARREAAFVFIFVTVLLDMLAIGIVIPVLPKLVVDFVGGDTEEAARDFRYVRHRMGVDAVFVLAGSGRAVGHVSAAGR